MLPPFRGRGWTSEMVRRDALVNSLFTVSSLFLEQKSVASEVSTWSTLLGVISSSMVIIYCWRGTLGINSFGRRILSTILIRFSLLARKNDIELSWVLEIRNRIPGIHRILFFTVEVLYPPCSTHALLLWHAQLQFWGSVPSHTIFSTGWYHGRV